MLFFFIYSIKLSVSLSVVFLFYRFVLRKLTFYNHHRWYLLGYTLLSFFIPLINISPALEKNNWNSSDVVSWIPVIHTTTPGLQEITPGGFHVQGTIILIMGAGMVIMLIRLLLHLLSFQRMMKKALPVSTEGMNLYQVNENIIPFSFGNSIFINRHLHSEKELEEIIRHEFVHVKQRHSLDIIWAEVLCLINWFNPFAWMLRRSIRQNLEFIADQKVLENGINKKEYQYLLLKVIGNNQYSIAAPFNFSSLKKRIAMMNKLQSAKANLLRFLFILPLLAVILLSFRNQLRETLIVRGSPAEITTVFNQDTLPGIRNLNDKGYFIEFRKNKRKDNLLIIISDKDEKEVKRLTIDEWNKRMDYYVDLYGNLPSLPQPPDGPPAPSIPPTPPTPPTPPVSGLSSASVVVAGTAIDLDAASVSTPVTLAGVSIAPAQASVPTPAALAGAGNRSSSIASVSALENTTVSGNVTMADEAGNLMTGDEAIIITITKNTTRQELDEFVKQMKTKGVEMSYDEIEYDNNGILINISGSLKSKTGHSNFVGQGFSKLVLVLMKKGEKTWFKVSVTDGKM